MGFMFKSFFTSLFFISFFIAVRSQEEEGSLPDCVDDEDCGMNGFCDNSAGGFCVCVGRWDGRFCNESAYCNEEPEPCNGGECVPGDGELSDQEFVCTCFNDSYVGVTCDLGVCAEDTDTSPGGESVGFGQANQNQISSSNATCEEVGFFNGLPLGTRKCRSNFQWDDTVWINDCSANLLDLKTPEQTDALFVASSALSEAEEKNVKDMFTSFTELSSQASTSSEVSLLISTANNFLRADDSLIDSLPDFADTIRQNLAKMVDSVDLAITSPDLEFFENFETELAVAAVNVAAGDSGVETRELSNYVIGLSNALQNRDGLIGAEFQYGPTNPDVLPLYASFMSALQQLNGQCEASSVCGVQMGSWQLDLKTGKSLRCLLAKQSDSDLHVESLIMRADSPGTEIIANLTIKFYLFEFYNNLNETGYDPDSNRTFYCSSWIEDSWSEDSRDCSVLSVATTTLYNYVTCDCSISAGHYAVISKIELSDGSSGGDPNDPNNPNNNNNNNGLTEGEIAGIVIGSVAGVFLIVAGIAYVMKRNGKKKKTTQVLPMHATHHSSFDEDNHYKDSRRSSSNKQD